MAERELQGCRRQRDAVSVADGLDPTNLVQHVGRGIRIVVLGPVDGAGGGDARAEDGADDDADVAALAVGQLLFQRVVLHERVAQRQQEEVEIDQIEEARHHAELVDAGADAHDQARGPQLVERPPTGGGELGHERLDLGLDAVVPEVEVVDDQEIDAVHAEALQAVLVGAHDAIVAVVEDMVEMQPARPESGVEALGMTRGLEDAPDLGRQDELAARLAVEKAADAMLALAAAVPGRRVVVADAGVPGGLQRRLGVRLADPREQLAQGGAAEAEARQHDLGFAEPARFERVHGRLPPRVGASAGRRAFAGRRAGRRR